MTGVGLAATVQGVLPGNALGFGPLPYSLGGVTMYINGVAVPLYSVSNFNGVQQINFQTPCETAPGLATAVIQVNGATHGCQRHTGPAHATRYLKLRWT